jgi:hypothetical protein
MRRMHGRVVLPSLSCHPAQLQGLLPWSGGVDAQVVGRKHRIHSEWTESTIQMIH